MQGLDIHGSYEKNNHIIPKDVKIEEHNYDGTPFSHYYILSKGNKVLSPVYFGAGGYYPDEAQNILKEFFK